VPAAGSTKRGVPLDKGCMAHAALVDTNDDTLLGRERERERGRTHQCSGASLPTIVDPSTELPVMALPHATVPWAVTLVCAATPLCARRTTGNHRKPFRRAQKIINQVQRQPRDPTCGTVGQWSSAALPSQGEGAVLTMSIATTVAAAAIRMLSLISSR
jgi:hypothetical protein